jgi:hypothetical protein
LLLIREMLAESSFDWRSGTAKILLASVGGVFALINLLAIFVEAHRYAVGAHGPLGFWTAPLWSPPGGYWPWLTVAMLGAGAMGVWTVLTIRDVGARPTVHVAG